MNDFIFVFNHQDYFDHYVFDDYWNLNYTREECVDKLTSLYQLILENEEPENQDYLLLKGVIAAYLYNLDATEFYSDVVENFNKVQEFPEYDYRCLWFLGNFFVDTTLVSEGLKPFDRIFEAFSEEYLPPPLFYDYAMACYLNIMPMSSLRAFEKYEKLSGKSLQNDYVYNQILELAHDYTGEDTSSNMFVRIQNRGGMDGVFIRPYGLWYHLKDDWNVPIFKFMEDRHYVMGESVPIEKNGRNIGYSVLLFSNLSESKECMAYSTFLNNFEKYESCYFVELFPERPDILVAEYRDSSLYPDLGGAHGYLALIVKPWTETADCDMEISEFQLPSSNENLYTYTLGDFYKRYKGYVVHYIILDSCEYIFEESKTDFINFIEDCQFF